jgi:hypothetical protein
MNSGDSQTEPKKKSRRFYVVLVAAVLLIAVIVGVVILELSSIGNTRYGPGPVEIEVTPDKPSYLQGEEVQFSICVNNEQNWRVIYPNTVTYRIGEDWALTIEGDYGSFVEYFPAHSRTLYRTYVWNQPIGENSTLAQPGNYTFIVSFEGPVNYGNSGNCTFEIRPNPQS